MRRRDLMSRIRPGPSNQPQPIRSSFTTSVRASQSVRPLLRGSATACSPRFCEAVMAPLKLCIPGERLCSAEDGTPGNGTYSRHGYIFASLAGYVVKENDNGMVPVISVVRDSEPQLLPEVGVVVTCKVTSINPRFVKVHILYVRSTPLKGTFRGTIRREDIRATEKDKELSEEQCLTLGIYFIGCEALRNDLGIRKISLGDAQSNYLLTTAENELGVVVAHSEAGEQMVPISWCEMQCPKSHGKEFRKVARVQPEFLHT
ncbi:exosome complex component CSL4 isoform X1 [Stegostoma tigrinum]|uniref:exosome complex component CSL4 isoform X1 n=1 Tax=Stegostoma tigrinum TaxID=3053191 RepID=UPI00202B9433|nr:exosome complex component CSL4 isoform X1 [Stegostoma tigrinum]